jgi:hypothetical protein
MSSAGASWCRSGISRTSSLRPPKPHWEQRSDLRVFRQTVSPGERNFAVRYASSLKRNWPLAQSAGRPITIAGRGDLAMALLVYLVTDILALALVGAAAGVFVFIV